jgi:hypothetical protein
VAAAADRDKTTIERLSSEGWPTGDARIACYSSNVGIGKSIKFTLTTLKCARVKVDVARRDMPRRVPSVLAVARAGGATGLGKQNGVQRPGDLCFWDRIWSAASSSVD